ncbi:MAG: AAA family ATPase [Hydrogenothermaceae bacterium]|nr:AAA family ATPase [Hydrogenothermaceae bacterium]
MAVKKISYEELLIDIKAEKSSREVEPAPFFSGQSRVEKVFNTGLSVKSEGYNIFVAGPDGSGRTVYTKLKLEEASLKMEPPEGIVYYHNFEEPLKLKYILLKKGTGRYLSLKVDSIIQRLKEECIKILEDKRYEDEKIRILKQAEDRRERIFEELRDRALQHNLGVVITPTGINLLQS